MPDVRSGSRSSDQGSSDEAVDSSSSQVRELRGSVEHAGGDHQPGSAHRIVSVSVEQPTSGDGDEFEIRGAHAALTKALIRDLGLPEDLARVAAHAVRQRSDLVRRDRYALALIGRYKDRKVKPDEAAGKGGMDLGMLERTGSPKVVRLNEKREAG